MSCEASGMESYYRRNGSANRVEAEMEKPGFAGRAKIVKRLKPEMSVQPVILTFMERQEKVRAFFDFLPLQMLPQGRIDKLTEYLCFRCGNPAKNVPLPIEKGFLSYVPPRKLYCGGSLYTQNCFSR